MTQNLHSFNPRSENISELLKQLTLKIVYENIFK
ncbi:hypothetical protein BXY82_0414 [Gelidibacter sediminis]|uniref:Uncharacterized protein n=1 Tax=Gelidibacter sediminis TaxID=1608710 RepID=A0A4R7Q7Z4_9FLAO|nr:hypothetical protein BXY82_0414 [Gelidibacter sediminis]